MIYWAWVRKILIWVVLHTDGWLSEFLADILYPSNMEITFED